MSKTCTDDIIKSPEDFENRYDYTVYNHKIHGFPKVHQLSNLNCAGLLDVIVL